ncbi:MAG: type II secretion system GspH family protein [Oscillospiraceae bacterium]|nr:type II secretion system GspH family protein [Oscillospiraceae bacterium]
MIRYLQRQIAKRGFTMIELIVVIAIIAALMAVILPSLTGERERINAANSAARDFYAAVQTTVSKYSTYDGQLSPAYINNNNLGVIRYYPLMGGNYPYDASYDHANTDSEPPLPASLYIMVHAQNDVIRDVAAVTRAQANTSANPGIYTLLQRNAADRNTEFGKLLVNEIDDRLVFTDGWYYARVDFNYTTSVFGAVEDIKLNTVKVAYAAYSRNELPQASGSYGSFQDSALTFGSDYKLNTGDICGTCASWDSTSNTRIGMAGTRLE